MPGSAEETSMIQEVLDVTFQDKVTRDRKKDDKLADRFVAVSCLRSEHPALWDRYANRREEVMEARICQVSEFVKPATMHCALASRNILQDEHLQNPSNQAYLLHGTNPTSAVSILANSFSVNLAGTSVGTMFGPGIYLAESSTKADEYARDDVGGEYDGLYAMLVCRALVGRSLVTEHGGDYSKNVLSGDYDSVLGDRERAVGTFREFVFFQEASLFPEYVVLYRRERGGRVIKPQRLVEAPPQECMFES